MRISRAFLVQIIQHARDELPNECCGIVGMSNGAAVKVYPAENIHRSPTRFEIDGRDVIRVMTDVEARGWELGSIYHSHTRTAAYPSQTDVNFAANWPGLEWLIVGTGGAEAVVRSYRIDDGRINEVEVVVEDA